VKLTFGEKDELVNREGCWRFSFRLLTIWLGDSLGSSFLASDRYLRELEAALQGAHSCTRCSFALRRVFLLLC